MPCKNKEVKGKGAAQAGGQAEAALLLVTGGLRKIDSLLFTLLSRRGWLIQLCG
jgi:hypothetical protein